MRGDEGGSHRRDGGRFPGLHRWVFGPVQGFTATYRTLRRASVHLGSVYEILDGPDPTGDIARTVDVESVRGEVRFDNVTFSHAGGPARSS